MSNETQDAILAAIARPRPDGLEGRVIAVLLDSETYTTLIGEAVRMMGTYAEYLGPPQRYKLADASTVEIPTLRIPMLLYDDGCTLPVFP